MYDANFELLTIIDVQDTTISAGVTIGCTFTTEGWSELVAGLYYAVIYSKTTGGEWESIGNGSFQNKEQFRIGIIDECSDKVVYECDFESELLDWTFAKADGINTGFAVGSATKYQGEKSLYISPDGGQSTGYTQDSDSGYVSVAYKKIYLEAGSYDFAWRIYRKLSYSYTDVFSDADYYNIAIVPAENEIEAQSSFQRIPSFLNNSVYRYYYTDSYSSWNSYSYNFLISKPGNYYLVHSFSATDTITNTTGVAIDNITIEKRRSKYSSSISVSKTETKEGVVFNISGDYPEYRLYWYTDCDRSYKRDTINTNSYTIPFTKLRDVVRAYGDLYFSVSATDDCGKSTGTSSWYSVYTNEFSVDTCILKPTVTAINIARFYSDDEGATWSAPEDIAESIYSQFDASSYGPVKAMFVASGRIMQSQTVKVGEYYRLYCSVLVRDVNDNYTNYKNFVLFSDDFGGEWSVLGGTAKAAITTADEAKVEELPNGSLLISSRTNGGRYYNIFDFDNVATGTGKWQTQSFSGSNNSGVTARDNSTNGEVMILPVVRQKDGQKSYLLLQSVPLGPNRSNVGVYFKSLDSEEGYTSSDRIAKSWEGVFKLTNLDSAYSTMTLQADGNVALLWEEATHCAGGDGYTIVYGRYSVEQLTGNAYRLQ